MIRDWKTQDQIKAALESADGNLADAAGKVGLSLPALQRKIKKLGLQRLLSPPKPAPGPEA